MGHCVAETGVLTMPPDTVKVDRTMRARRVPWRLREGESYHCERMPDVPSPNDDIELINTGRMPLPILREKLAQ
jgi:hypothetical protein